MTSPIGNVTVIQRREEVEKKVLAFSRENAHFLKLSLHPHRPGKSAPLIRKYGHQTLLSLLFADRYSFDRETYLFSWVLTLIFSPTLMNSGTCIVAPDSNVAIFVPP